MSSGIFGDKKTMRTIPNSNYKPKKVSVPKAKGMPSVKPPQANKLQGENVADAYTINQGRPKKVKLTVAQARKMPLAKLEKRLK